MVSTIPCQCRYAPAPGHDAWVCKLCPWQAGPPEHTHAQHPARHQTALPAHAAAMAFDEKHLTNSLIHQASHLSNLHCHWLLTMCLPVCLPCRPPPWPIQPPQVLHSRQPQSGLPSTVANSLVISAVQAASLARTASAGPPQPAPPIWPSIHNCQQPHSFQLCRPPPWPAQPLQPLTPAAWQTLGSASTLTEWLTS